MTLYAVKVQLFTACCMEELRQHFLCQQVDMLRVVVRLGRNRHDNIPLRHSDRRGDGPVDLRYMFQYLQQGDNIKAVIREWLITYAFLLRAKLMEAAVGKLIKKGHPLFQEIQGSYLHPRELLHEGNQKNSAPAADIQHGFK